MGNFEQWLTESIVPLLKAVQANLTDHVSVLVACDWLEDNGEEDLAQTIRWLVTHSRPQSGIPHEAVAAEAEKYKDKLRKLIGRYKNWKLDVDSNRVSNTSDYRQYSLQGNRIVSNSKDEMPEEVAKIFLAWRALLAFDSGFTKGGHMANVSNAEAATLLNRLISSHRSDLDLLSDPHGHNIIGNQADRQAALRVLQDDFPHALEQVEQMVKDMEHIFSLVPKNYRFYQPENAETLEYVGRQLNGNGHTQLGQQLRKFARRMV